MFVQTDVLACAPGEQESESALPQRANGALEKCPSLGSGNNEYKIIDFHPAIVPAIA